MQRCGRCNLLLRGQLDEEQGMEKSSFLDKLRNHNVIRSIKKQKRVQDIIDRYRKTFPGKPDRNEFIFMPGIDLEDSNALSEAIHNMMHNAQCLQAHIQKYISSWEDMAFAKKLLHNVGKPVAKAAAGMVGWGAAYEGTMDIGKEFWGGILDACNQVVSRTCADMKVAAYQYHPGKAQMASVCAAFVLLYNTLDIESYEDIQKKLPNTAVRQIVAAKFHGCSLEVANSFVQVMAVMQSIYSASKMDDMERMLAARDGLQGGKQQLVPDENPEDD